MRNRESITLPRRSSWPRQSRDAETVRIEADYMPPFNRHNAYWGFIGRALLAAFALQLLGFPCLWPLMIGYCWFGALAIMRRWRWVLGEPLTLVFQADSLTIEGGLFGETKHLALAHIESFYLTPHYHYQYLRQESFACAWQIQVAYGEQRWPISEHGCRDEAEQLQIRLVSLLQAAREDRLFPSMTDECSQKSRVHLPGPY